VGGLIRKLRSNQRTSCPDPRGGREMTARAQTTCGETGCRSRRLAASPPMRQGAGPAGLGSHRYPATRGTPAARQSGYCTLRCYAALEGYCFCVHSISAGGQPHRNDWFRQRLVAAVKPPNIFCGRRGEVSDVGHMRDRGDYELTRIARERNDRQ